MVHLPPVRLAASEPAPSLDFAHSFRLKLIKNVIISRLPDITDQTRPGEVVALANASKRNPSLPSTVQTQPRAHNSTLTTPLSESSWM
jgi:hypothetical protein